MPQPINGIAATMFHGEGAIAQCGRCRRYTLDRSALSDRQPICTCGERHYWSGSFMPPGPDAQWYGPAPEAQAAPAATSSPRDDYEDGDSFADYGQAAPAAVAEPEYPAGAIVNGRTLMDRLEQAHSFECEAGPLSMCSDWHELRRCFEHLASHAGAQAAAPATAHMVMADQQATLLNQAHDMLLAHADDMRSRGNDSEAAGAECSADAVLKPGTAWTATQPVARMHPDGRVIPESTYAQAAADGGASWRVVVGYTIKLGPVGEAQPAAREAGHD